MALSRGAFIVFEGIDRCGKSTQSSMLVERLKAQNIPVELWRFPDRQCKTTGKTIASYLSKDIDLSDEAIHLLFSANRWEKKAEIERKLCAGVTLVVDRYAYSGIVYSAAKKKRNMTMDWCMACDAGLPAPDRVLYMQISPEASAKRGGYGGERYEKLAFQTTVALMFDQLKDSRWLCIDADQSVEVIHEQVVAEAMKVIASVAASGCPADTLWGRDIKVTAPGMDGIIASEEPATKQAPVPAHLESDKILGRDQQAA